MYRILAVAAPFPLSLIFNAVHVSQENKVKASGYRMTPAELLAFTRNRDRK